jgi:hypothetical protein
LAQALRDVARERAAVAASEERARVRVGGVCVCVWVVLHVHVRLLLYATAHRTRFQALASERDGMLLAFKPMQQRLASLEIEHNASLNAQREMKAALAVATVRVHCLSVVVLDTSCCTPTQSELTSMRRALTASQKAEAEAQAAVAHLKQVRVLFAVCVVLQRSTCSHVSPHIHIAQRAAQFDWPKKGAVEQRYEAAIAKLTEATQAHQVLHACARVCVCACVHELLAADARANARHRARAGARSRECRRGRSC